MSTIAENRLINNIELTNNKSTITVTMAQQGATGQGVPAGGNTNDFLIKVDGTDFNTTWSATSTVWGGIGGVLSD